MIPLVKKYITGNNIATTANIIVKETFKISSFFIVFIFICITYHIWHRTLDL